MHKGLVAHDAVVVLDQRTGFPACQVEVVAARRSQGQLESCRLLTSQGQGSSELQEHLEAQAQSKVPADRTSHPGVQEQPVKGVLVLLDVLEVQEPWRQQEQRLGKMDFPECQLHQ